MLRPSNPQRDDALSLWTYPPDLSLGLHETPSFAMMSPIDRMIDKTCLHNVIIHSDGSPTQELILTAAIRDLHQTYPGTFSTDIRLRWPQIWENNPYLSGSRLKEGEAIEVDLRGSLLEVTEENVSNLFLAYVDALDRQLGIKIMPTLCKGDIHISPLEKSWISQIEEMVHVDLPFWLLLPAGNAGTEGEEDPYVVYQQVVESYEDKILFVQACRFGSVYPKLSGAVDLRGKTDIRQLIRLIYHSQGAIGARSFEMHLAASVESKPSYSAQRACFITDEFSKGNVSAIPRNSWDTQRAKADASANDQILSYPAAKLGEDRSDTIRLGSSNDVPDASAKNRIAQLVDQIDSFFSNDGLAYLDETQLRRYQEASASIDPIVLHPIENPGSTLTTICVLTHGDHLDLVSRCLSSIQCACDTRLYRLVVGANCPSGRVTKYLTDLSELGIISHLEISEINIEKYPMMNRLFQHVHSTYVWWFDDDSFINDYTALEKRIILAQSSPPKVVLWGHEFYCREADFAFSTEVTKFVESASWYRGLAVPTPKGNDSSNLAAEKAVREDRWFYMRDECWFADARALREINWPDRALIRSAGNIFLCEAIRQQGWNHQDIGPCGTEITSSGRRGALVDQFTMHRQMSSRFRPRVTICVLTYGDYLSLITRCLESIQNFCNRYDYKLVVGMNAVCRDTEMYLQDLLAKGAIDVLLGTPLNINKNPMMRRMFEHADTEYIWWFDDDSYVTKDSALPMRSHRADAAPRSTVMWGHQFFFGNEKDFSYGTDVVTFVKQASWYRELEPPSWEVGGKGVTDFQGKGIGDGRWFFLTGGCWFIRTEAVRALDWPDRRLIKRNDDVFLCEAIRQQGWNCSNIGASDVAINKAKRRGTGEDRKSMLRQVGVIPSPSGEGNCAKGCVFLPTFRDTERLRENFAGRPELTAEIDFYVYDDNHGDECLVVAKLCEDNGWHYRRSGRGLHGTIRQDRNDRAPYNRFIYHTLITLGQDYDFVVKLDTDTYIVDPTWHSEVATTLANRCAIIGTRESRPVKDVSGFWNVAERHGYEQPTGRRCVHMQGGLYGISKEGLTKLRAMGFLDGIHVGFGEDCYMSYCCQLLGLEFIEAKTFGAWCRPYRPKFRRIRDLKAIHPVTKSEWLELCAAFSESATAP